MKPHIIIMCTGGGDQASAAAQALRRGVTRGARATITEEQSSGLRNHASTERWEGPPRAFAGFNTNRHPPPPLPTQTDGGR